METLFLLLQLVTGMMVLAAALALGAIVLLHRTVAFMKEGAGVLGYVAALFTSGFTKGHAPEPSGWKISPAQIGLGALLAIMLVSLFLPDAKTFLHVVAVLAGVAVVWYVMMLMRAVRLEILCLPALIMWFVYYLMCIFWRVQPQTP